MLPSHPLAYVLTAVGFLIFLGVCRQMRERDEARGRVARPVKRRTLIRSIIASLVVFFAAAATAINGPAAAQDAATAIAFLSALSAGLMTDALGEAD